MFVARLFQDLFFDFIAHLEFDNLGHIPNADRIGSRFSFWFCSLGAGLGRVIFCLLN